MKGGYVYILANKINGTIYTGVTSDLLQRVWQHKETLSEGFTKKYEEHPTIQDAIAREKQLKNWRRAWKLQLINQFNPDWRDLYENIF